MFINYFQEVKARWPQRSSVAFCAVKRRIFNVTGQGILPLTQLAQIPLINIQKICFILNKIGICKPSPEKN